MHRDAYEDALRDIDTDAAFALAHVPCIECGIDGCRGCPSALCTLPELVDHGGEAMCAGCVPAFDRHTENRCDGMTCHCPAIPVLVADDEPETTPIKNVPMAMIVAERLR